MTIHYYHSDFPIPKVFKNSRCTFDPFGETDSNIKTGKIGIRCHNKFVAFFLSLIGKIQKAQTQNGEVVYLNKNSFQKWMARHNYKNDTKDKTAKISEIVTSILKTQKKEDVYQANKLTKGDAAATKIQNAFRAHSSKKEAVAKAKKIRSQLKTFRKIESYLKLNFGAKTCKNYSEYKNALNEKTPLIEATEAAKAQVETNKRSWRLPGGPSYSPEDQQKIDQLSLEVSELKKQLDAGRRKFLTQLKNDTRTLQKELKRLSDAEQKLLENETASPTKRIKEKAPQSALQQIINHPVINKYLSLETNHRATAGIGVLMQNPVTKKIIETNLKNLEKLQQFENELAKLPETAPIKQVFNEIESRGMHDLVKLLKTYFFHFETGVIKSFEMDGDTIILSLEKPLHLWVMSLDEHAEQDPEGGAIMSFGKKIRIQMDAESKSIEFNLDASGHRDRNGNGFKIFLNRDVKNAALRTLAKSVGASGFGEVIPTTISQLSSQIKFSAGVKYKIFKELFMEKERTKDHIHFFLPWIFGEVYDGNNITDFINQKIKLSLENS